MRAVLFLLTVLGSLVAAAAPSPTSSLAIRGTLPWHNFLSGPTAWDEEDYVRYLDRLKELGLNYVAFHCYTGGAERYGPYVEPLIKVSYRDVLPEAGLDTSLTARWGYRPLRVSEFAFGTADLFKLPAGAEAFGARGAILARSNAERYANAQALMRRVIGLAHERGIQVGLGFEFGIHPPELASIVPPGSLIRGALLPDPTHPASIEILQRTLDDILQTYPDLDWIWLWLHEHTMHVGKPALSGGFRDLLQREGALFAGETEETVFTGVWSLEYVRRAYTYLQRRAPRVRLAISGWGGGTQLPGILRGLDRALPRDIVFSCLNPNQGWAPQLPVLAEMAGHRQVWAIPWLEGDRSLWHFQPRVALLREQVTLAAQQKLHGVLAIHWRTEETRANLAAFARFAAQPADAPSVESFYRDDCAQQFGAAAAGTLARLLTDLDREQAINVDSPEYFAYDPGWGRLKPELRQRLERHRTEITNLAKATTDARHRANLEWLGTDFEFTLLLDEVSRQLEPAYRLKESYLVAPVDPAGLSEARAQARESLNRAPIESLFRTYARRVRSKGELGVLSSLNQRLWLQYRELDTWLNNVTPPPSPPTADRPLDVGR